jgi:hypothetical protein
MALKLRLAPERILMAVLFGSIGLCVASYVTQYLKIKHGHSYIYGFVPFFNVDIEHNFSSWWSFSLLLIVAILLGVIAGADWVRAGRYRYHWAALALVFSWLSFDEATEWHERFIAPVAEALDPPRLFTFAWVIPGLVFVGVLGALYFSFLRALPAATARWFYLGALIYLSGALGMEMIGGWYYSHFKVDMVYVTLTHIEELLEMLGLSIFIYALLTHMRTERLEIGVGPES